MQQLRLDHDARGRLLSLRQLRHDERLRLTKRVSHPCWGAYGRPSLIFQPALKCNVGEPPNVRIEDVYER